MDVCQKLFRLCIVICVFSLLCTNTCLAISLESSIKPVQQRHSATSMDVIVFPFADYSKDSNFELQLRRNVLVQEAVHDELFRRGFYALPKDDIQRYLIDRQIIQLETTSAPITTNVAESFWVSGWDTTTFPEPTELQTVGLSRTELSRIADEFNTRYAIRGRILEYKLEDATSNLPYRTGVLPFVFRLGNQILYGFSTPEGYETSRRWNNSDLGSMLKNTGVQPALQSIIDGGTKLLGLRGGHVKESVIHVRLSLQDLQTGKILWTNRAEVKASSSNILAENRDRELTTSAIRHTVSGIFQTFPDVVPSNSSPNVIEFRLINIDETQIDPELQRLQSAISLEQLHSSQVLLSQANSFDTASFMRPHRLNDGFFRNQTDRNVHETTQAIQELKRRTQKLQPNRVNRDLMLRDLENMEDALTS